MPVDAPEEEQVARCIRHVRLVEVNDAMFRMYGCTEAKQLLGTQLSSTFDLADPRSIEFFRAFVRSGYRTVELESYEFDRLGAPHWFVNNLLGVVEDGRLTAIWGTQRDVTERRHHEEMVRAARDQLTAMVEASPLPIVGVAPGRRGDDLEPRGGDRLRLDGGGGGRAAARCACRRTSRPSSTSSAATCCRATRSPRARRCASGRTAPGST